MAIQDLNKSLTDLSSTATDVYRGLSQFNSNLGTGGIEQYLPKEDLPTQEKGIMERYTERKKLAETGTEAAKKLTESAYQTSKASIEEKTLGETATARETMRNLGPASSYALVSKMEETGRRRLSDLTKARDDLLLKQDVAKADRLDNLMISEQETLTSTRKSFLDTIFGISAERRAQTGFETPAQKTLRESQAKENELLNTVKSNYPDIPGISNTKTYAEAIGLVGPEIKKDRELERKVKESQIAENYAAIAAKKASVGGTKLPAPQVVNLSDAQFLPNLLNDLENTVNNNKNLFGVISGRIPFSEDRLIVDAELRRIAQTVGKFMEGGVLRKEDEEKYYKMLPQLTDLNPDVALSKLEGVRTMLSLKYNGYLKDFSGSGYDVSGFKEISFGKNRESSRQLNSTGEEGKPAKGLNYTFTNDNMFYNLWNK